VYCEECPEPSVSGWEEGHIRGKDAFRARLKERLDGAHDVRVIALGVRAREGYICCTSISTSDRDRADARTHLRRWWIGQRERVEAGWPVGAPDARRHAQAARGGDPSR
jgi:hypothetical protein